MLLPEHTGLLLPADGAAGVVGSVRVTGPATGAEGQPVDTSVTTKLEYEPAVRPVITNWPLPLLEIVNGPCAPPGVLV